ncbi:MAG TPA: hypothetical protein VEQ60_10075 [Longimicrobium sp.]|nr:hypothetical protein [Longimicrobium sp.]
MTAKPTGWNRFIANLQGEVRAEELEAFHRARAAVFELLERMEHRRLECGIDGLDPWSVPPATRTAFLCAWNAFVLQTVGDELLQADFRAEPSTPGYVPPTTAEEVLRFYEPVEGWVNRAWQAEANPDYQLDVEVPAPLPPWLDVYPVTPAHLDGLLRAMHAVRDHAEAALALLPTAPQKDRRKQAQLNHIHQACASALAHFRYAEHLGGSDAGPEVRARVRERARSCIEELYRVGQLACDPERAQSAEPASPQIAAPERTPPRPVPDPPPRAAVQRAPAREPEDPAGTQTNTGPPGAVEFIDNRTGVSYELYLNAVRKQGTQFVVLNIITRSPQQYAMLPLATVTLRAAGENEVLPVMPGHTSRVSSWKGSSWFEERAGFALPVGMLDELCYAEDVELSIGTYRALKVNAGAVAALQAHAREFRRGLRSFAGPVDDADPTLSGSAAAVKFSDDLSGVDFELRLRAAGTQKGLSIALQIVARRADKQPALAVSTVTLRTDRQTVVLRMVAEHKSRSGKALYEERVEFAFSVSLTENVCKSSRVGMSIVNYGMNVELDAVALEDFQAHCCAFSNARRRARGS